MDNRQPIDYKKWGINPISSSSPKNEVLDYKKWGINPISDLDEKKDSSSRNIDSKMLSNIPGMQSAFETGKKVPGASVQVLKDIGNLVAAAPKALTGAISAIPSGIESLKRETPLSMQQIGENPLRAAKNVIAGTSEAAGKISRIPPALVDYLAHIGMITPETAKQYLRPPGEEEFSKMASQFVGGGEQPGDVGIRGTFRNLPELLGAGKIAKAVNPMQLSAKNIARDIIKSKESAKALFSGEKGRYTDLFNRARDKGLGDVKFNPEMIHLEDIKAHSNPKYTENLKKFLDNPDIEVAQKAQSDLKKLVDYFDKKVSMTEPEQRSYQAAKAAREHIEESMFKGHPELQKEYSEITKAYAKDVIPYTTNKSIKEFQRGDITEKQLIDRLSKKPKITAKHKAIPIRRAILPLGGIGLAGYGGYELAKPLIEKLLGKNERET